MLVGLAAAQVVVAVAYQATWAQSFDMTMELRTGAPIQVQFDRGGGSDAELGTIQDLPGVSGVAPVDAVSAGVGTEFAVLIAATPWTVDSLANTGLGTFGRSDAAELISPEPWAPELPAGGTVALTSAGDPAGRVSLLLFDASGRSATVELVPDDAGRLAGELPPPLVGAWSLQGLDVVGAASFEARPRSRWTAPPWISGLVGIAAGAG